MFPLLSEKAVEEAVRNCEQLKQREQEEDNVTLEELDEEPGQCWREVVEKERVSARRGMAEGESERMILSRLI